MLQRDPPQQCKEQVDQKSQHSLPERRQRQSFQRIHPIRFMTVKATARRARLAFHGLKDCPQLEAIGQLVKILFTLITNSQDNFPVSTCEKCLIPSVSPE